MKAKKIYNAPVLKSQKVELGVFGNYNDTDLPVRRDPRYPWGLDGMGRNRME